MNSPTRFSALAADHPSLWHAGGWQVLLPPLAQRHVLCADSQGWVAALLAAHCSRVTVWCPAAAAATVRTRLAALQLTNTSVLGLAPGPQPLLDAVAALPAPFDGIVIAHTELWRRLDEPAGNTAPASAAWAELAQTALSDQGFFYMECGNRWAVRSRANRPERSSGAALDRPQRGPRQARRLLRRHGAAQVRVHPYLLSQERLEEILPPPGYVATKNRELRRERMKELLFSRWGAPWLAHAYGVVAFKQGQAHSVLDLIMERVAALPDAPAGLRLTKTLVFNSMKLILVVEPPRRGEGLVVVVTCDDVVVQRRAQEAQVLEALQQLSPEVAGLVPRLRARLQVHGYECFVLSQLPGLTLEADVAQLEPLTTRAVGFLVELNRHAAASAAVDEAVFDRVIAPVFDHAMGATTALRGELLQLRELVRTHTAGRPVHIGWFHGDFKIENVTYDPASLQLTGVLDWEHAARHGLPYLDLLYLLIYNRGIRGQGWMDAFAQLLLDGAWTEAERRLEQQFLQGSDGLAENTPWLATLFLVHHFGVRMGLTQWSAAELQRLRTLLARCAQAMAGGPLPRSAARNEATGQRRSETVNP